MLIQNDHAERKKRGNEKKALHYLYLNMSALQNSCNYIYVYVGKLEFRTMTVAKSV